MSSFQETVFFQDINRDPIASSTTISSLRTHCSSVQPKARTTHEPESTRVDLQALRRKIDWRVVPTMFLCYTMQFLDKVNINYAAVMGLNTDLELTGNDFSNASTAFFVAYLIAEVPNSYFLHRVPAGKWLGLNVVAWGIVSACTAATMNYQTLLIARIFLGIFEAAIAPSLMLIGSQWYTRSEQAPRFSLWYCGLGIAQILGGVVSFAFQHVETEGIAGWRIMFIALGFLTVVIGILTTLVLPDSPMTAKFLSVAEKAVLLNHVSENRTSIEIRRFKPSQALELLLDTQVWLMTIITILISVSSGVITTYSSTIIKQFGYTSQVSALLSMPSGVVSLLATMIVGYGIRYTSNRWAWLVTCCASGIIGGGLMSFAPSNNHAALLAGIYLVNAITATLIIIYQWTMANTAGRTKRVIASTLIAGSFSIGNIIGPQTFQAKDAPKYQPAKVIVLATQAVAAFLTVILYLYYIRSNRQKQKEQLRLESDGFEMNRAEASWGDPTDKENLEFRYVY